MKKFLRPDWPSMAIAAVLLGVGLILFLAFGPILFPSIKFEEFVTVEPVDPRPGGHITMERRYTVSSPVTVKVTRVMVPVGPPTRPIYTLAETTTAFKPGYYQRQRVHELPTYVIPGRYRLESVAHWRQNAFRETNVALKPVEIDVR